jgi:hypothetical protein
VDVDQRVARAGEAQAGGRGWEGLGPLAAAAAAAAAGGRSGGVGVVVVAIGGGGAGAVLCVLGFLGGRGRGGCW